MPCEHYSKSLTAAVCKVREMENADHLTTHKDYSESVDALERAIATLKKQAYDRTQLLQVKQLELRQNMSVNHVVNESQPHPI